MELESTPLEAQVQLTLFNQMADGKRTPAVEVSNLFFRFNPDTPDILRDVNLELQRGSRCLLIGANGAGKSPLFLNTFRVDNVPSITLLLSVCLLREINFAPNPRW